MDPHADTAADYFGAMVDDYDRLIRSALPRYQEMIDTLVDFLPEHPPRVLELGCGTGTFTLAIAARAPQAVMTVVDASPEMVEVTRSRLTSQAPEVARRSTFLVERFEALELPSGSFDLVTSCISLHHVVDKGALFRDVRRFLTPGGTFRFADQLLGGTPHNHAVLWSRWLEFCRGEGRCSEEEVSSLLHHAESHDHYESLERHFQLLSAAGFEGIDCPWRHGMWAVVTADQPHSTPSESPGTPTTPD